jgi:hypothetical protein
MSIEAQKGLLLAGLLWALGWSLPRFAREVRARRVAFAPGFTYLEELPSERTMRRQLASARSEVTRLLSA